MKTKFSKIALLLVLVLALVVPVLAINAFAADTVDTTITFDANKTQRTSFSSTQQVWQEGGVTFTNDQASSSNAVADYSNPVRLYAGSTVTIECTGMTQIAFNSHSTTKYKTAIETAIKTAGYTPTISGTTYTITFDAPVDSITLTFTAQARLYSVTVTSEVAEGACTHEGTETTEQVESESTCTTQGIVATVCSCGEVISRDKLPLADHSYGDDNLCSSCGKLDPLSVDYSGRFVIATIRSSGNYYVMTNALGDANTKRYQATETSFAELPSEFATANGNIVFVLERDDTDGTYVIYAEGIEGDEKYLGWTSGNSGILVAEASAKKLNVIMNDDGTYYFSFAINETTNKYLALNPSNNYFAWYDSLTSGASSLSLVPAVDATIKSARLEIGDDLSVLYRVNLSDSYDSAYSMKFTFNGVETVVTALEEIDGGLYFAFRGVAPQCMGDNISAELLYNGEVVDAKETYSVKEYVVNTLAETTDEKLINLLSTLLHYGKASQDFVDYNTGSYVTEGVEGIVAESEPDFVYEEMTGAASSSDVAALTGAGVRFSYNNKIFVKLTATDLTDVVVKIDGVEAEIVSYEGAYAVFTDGVLATEFDTVHTITLEVAGEVVQTVTYSINYYTYVMSTKGGATMQALVKALYNYGAAADAYKA